MFLAHDFNFIKGSFPLKQSIMRRFFKIKNIFAIKYEILMFSPVASLQSRNAKHSSVHADVALGDW